MFVLFYTPAVCIELNTGVEGLWVAGVLERIVNRGLCSVEVDCEQRIVECWSEL